jgi:hypothetical protein
VRPERTATQSATERRLLAPNLVLGAVLAAGLSAAAVVAAGGTELGANTWVQVALLVVGVSLAVGALLIGAPGQRWGLAAFLAFVALTALAYASITWSVQPASSWLEANRMLSYLATFGAAIVLARLLPGRWPALVGAVALATTAVSAYALLLKVFPETLDRVDQLGRLSQPLDYWNAVGLMAAMGVPVCLWAGAREDAPRWATALSPPAIAIAIVTLLLSYSRGALVVAVIGAALWFAVVPLRLRGALILSLGVAGAAAVTAWALPNHAITADYIPLADRVNAGHSLGLILIGVLLACLVAGWIASGALNGVVLAPRLRRRVGVTLLCVAALLPVGGVTALATSSRGFSGEISHFWSTVSNGNGGTGDQPGRLVEVSNSRPHYWSVGLQVGAHHLLLGAGGLGYGTAYTRYSNDRWPVRHAHSYAVETFADLGLLGLCVSLALLIAWGAAAARALRGPPTPERIGMLTLLVVVVVFGLHSLIDWTWFIPGTAIIALVCAGWLAGRGPLSNTVGVTSERRRLGVQPAGGLTVVALLAVTVIAVWGILQPLRSSDADAAAITSLLRGNGGAALTDARQAVASNPLSVDPLFVLSKIYPTQGNRAQARAELVQAARLQPDNPETWIQLAGYDLAQHQPGRAVVELARAKTLYRGSAQIASELSRAQAETSHPMR